MGRRVRSWRAYPIAGAAAAFAISSAAFAAMAAAVPLRGETVLVVLWCLVCAGAVGVAAWRLGPVFGVPLALAAAFAIDSFYIAPYRAFDSRDWVNYPVTAMYIAIGILVGAILEATQHRAATSEAARTKLAEEQAALRRIATLVAQGGPPEEVFAAVAGETRNLVRADVTRIIRLEADGTATVVGGTNADDRPGPLGPIEPGLATAEVSRTGRTARIDNYEGVAPELVARWFGAAGSSPHAVASPVIVAGTLWGTIVAGSLEGPLPEETDLRMAEFTELLASRSPTPRAAPSWRRPERASSSPPTKPGAGSSETCTTASSSAWSHSHYDCGGSSDGFPARTERSRRHCQRPSRS